MKVEINNPAGRLWHVLRQAKDHKNPNLAAVKVWPELLGVAGDNVPVILYRYGQVMRMPLRIKELVLQQADENHDLQLRWLPKVEAAFKSCNLDAAFSVFTGHYDETVLIGLEHTADMLARKRLETVLNEEEMQKICTDTSELLERIRVMDMDPDIKRFVMDRLDSVISAIQEYPLCGSQPLQHVVESTVGALAFQGDVRSKLENTPTGDDLWKIVMRVASLVQLANGAMQIGFGAIRLLD